MDPNPYAAPRHSAIRQKSRWISWTLVILLVICGPLLAFSSAWELVKTHHWHDAIGLGLGLATSILGGLGIWGMMQTKPVVPMPFPMRTLLIVLALGPLALAIMYSIAQPLLNLIDQ